MSVRKHADAVKDRVLSLDNTVTEDPDGESISKTPAELPLSIRARQAIDTVYRALSKSHPGLRGQRLSSYLPGVDASQVLTNSWEV